MIRAAVDPHRLQMDKKCRMLPPELPGTDVARELLINGISFYVPLIRVEGTAEGNGRNGRADFRDSNGNAQHSWAMLLKAVTYKHPEVQLQNSLSDEGERRFR